MCKSDYISPLYRTKNNFSQNTQNMPTPENDCAPENGALGSVIARNGTIQNSIENFDYKTQNENFLSNKQISLAFKPTRNIQKMSECGDNNYFIYNQHNESSLRDGIHIDKNKTIAYNKPNLVIPKLITKSTHEKKEHRIIGNIKITVNSPTHIEFTKVNSENKSISLPRTPLGNVNPSGSLIKILDPLEKGAYGAVYKCTEVAHESEANRTMAIKCIDTDVQGIPCLMEASIMSILNHPNLNRAIRVHATPKMLYIVSELAISDLSKWTRRDKAAHIPSAKELRKWSYSLIQATACLHRQQIIHGDIKASNVLLFQDGNIKLSDFTLSTMKWSSRGSPERRHTICTCTHRPLEVWLNREWDLEVDMWSLGCTLYEIAYGELLFPYQGNSKEGSLLRDKTINCLLDWAENGPSGKQAVSISRAQVDFIPFRLSPLFATQQYSLFNDLILSMLRIAPHERPSAIKLLDHPYFKQGDHLSPDPYEIISTPVSTLDQEEINRLNRHLMKFTQAAGVISLSIELYSRCTGIQNENDYIKLMTCLWIASKLMYRNPISSDISSSQILSMERIICSHLSFRLHVAALGD